MKQFLFTFLFFLGAFFAFAGANLYIIPYGGENFAITIQQ